MPARALRIAGDQRQRLGPGLGEAFGDLRPLADKIGREGAAGGKRIGLRIVEDVFGDHARFDGLGEAELIHDAGIRFKRIAAVERAGFHGVDVLAHVELIDGVIAVVQADLGENALGGVEIRRARRRHQFASLEVLKRRDLIGEARADDELLHAMRRVLAVHGDIHRRAGFLQVRIEPFERDQDDGNFDLPGDQRRDIGRAAHQRDGLRLQIEILEVAEIERDEIGQG